MIGAMTEPQGRPAWPERPHSRSERARRSTGAAASRAAAATRRGAAATRRGAVRASELARDRGARITLASRQTAHQLLQDAGPELRASLWRLRTVRSPHGAVAALEDEIAHLMVVVSPVLVAHPLPVRNAVSGRVVVGGAAAAVAVGEELNEVAALFSAGTTITPSVPLLVTAAFLSVAVEVAVATSLRVHDLRAAGIDPHPDAVARDVVFAMAGSKGAARGAITRQLVKRIAARVLSRWGTGLVPVVGAAYSAWDAQQTVAAVRKLPTPFHPAPATPALGAVSRLAPT
jgi:hypothetical protein